MICMLDTEVVEYKFTFGYVIDPDYIPACHIIAGRSGNASHFTEGSLIHEGSCQAIAIVTVRAVTAMRPSDNLDGEGRT